MDFWDKLASPAQSGTEQTAGAPKPKTESRDWLDDVIDRQGMTDRRDFVRSIFSQESSSGKSDTSQPNIQGARGPMQVKEQTFRDMQQRGYIPKDYRWDNPDHSAEAGVAYLKHGLETHGGDTRKAAAFYFGGPSAINKDGTINENRKDANGTTIREYMDSTHSRMGKPTAKPAKTAAKDPPKWSDVTASPEFAALSSDEREQLRVRYRDTVLPQVASGADLEALVERFDQSTPLSFFDNARLTFMQTARELKEGGRSATQGLRATTLTQDMQLIESHKANAAKARSLGDETAAAEYEAAAEAALASAKQMDKEISGSNKSSTFIPRYSVQKMMSAKGPEEAWNAFLENPTGIIAGITAQSAAAMAPGLVFAALSGGGIGGAVLMGANSGVMELGSSILDFAAENGVDTKSEGALVKFYSDPDNLRAGLDFAHKRSGVIALADTLSGGAASKTFAPKAVTSTLGKQAINVPTQMVVQAAGGAGGEAGAQVATKGKVDEWGQVLAEAVGEFATAPVDVAVLAKDAISGEKKSKSESLRDIAKKLRGEPIDAGAVVDNPTPSAGGALVVPQKRGVAGAPIPDNGPVTVETRESVNVTPDMVLDKGDAGAGNRPALPPPGGPSAPIQNEIRVDSQGNAVPTQVDRTVRQITNEPSLSGGIRVDSQGTASFETGAQASEAQSQRVSDEELGLSPTRVPATPERPKAKVKGKKKTLSLRSEYDANRALEERAKPGWTNPQGKSIEEVLRSRPRPKEDPKEESSPKRKKLFGLFSKASISRGPKGTYVAPAERAADPKFGRWFGSSKARQGSQPQVYFHGTTADIQEFQPKQAGAIFLSPSPKFAESFAHASLEWLKKHIPSMKPEVMAAVDEKARKMVRENYEAQDVDEETIKYYVDNVRMTDEWLYASMDALDSGPNVMPVFVRAERPFDGSNSEHAARVARHLSKGRGVFELQGTQWTEDDLIESLDQGGWTVIESPEVQAAIKALGHDSFYVTEGGQKNLAVYNSKQIKSAVGNTEFSESPRIIASKRKTGEASQKTGSDRQSAFKKWFSGSKVVNEKGEPLVVYHGTTKDVREFKPAEQRWRERGLDKQFPSEFERIKGQPEIHFFTEDPGIASGYADQDGAQNVIPVYLSIKNMVSDDVRDAGSRDRAIDEMLATGADGAAFWDTSVSGRYTHRAYVVRSSEQVKSATGNNGNFDAREKDITKSLGQPGGGITLDELTKVVDAMAAINKGANNITVQAVQSTEDVDGLDLKEGEVVDGIYLGEDGAIILIADAIPSAERAAEVLLHELVGHHGVESLVAAAGPGFERRWLSILQDVARVRAKGGYASMAAVSESYGNNPLINAMEVLARMAESGEKHTLLTKAVSLLRDVLRKLGIKLRMSDSDLIELVLRAKEHVRSAENASTEETKAWHSKLMSMSDEAASALMSQPSEPFYSALKRAVSAINAKAMSPKDWKSRLKGLKDVKRDEIEWSGVEEWLDTLEEGRVTKERVEEYLAQNGVRVEEVVLGGQTNRMQLGDEYHRAIDVSEAAGGAINPTYIQNLPESERRPEEQAVLDAWNAANENLDENAYGDAANPKYGQYTLPGGTNYREVLLTLPGAQQIMRKQWVVYDTNNDIVAVLPNEPTAERVALTARRGDRIEERMVPDKQAVERAGQYQSDHWDQPNILAHIRLNERADADGKRVLFVEEIQSDWGQEGKNRGFAQQEPTDYTIEVKLVGPWHPQFPEQRDKWRVTVNGQDRGYIQAEDENEARYKANANETNRRYNSDKVPSAPFVTSTGKWVDLALKRIIKLAVDEGYDKVAFINGEQSASRYDLSKQVRSIDWSGSVDKADSRIVTITPNSGNDIEFRVLPDGRTESISGGASGNEFTGKMLDGVVGKEVAKKIMADRSGSLSGNGLKVGGEGMKAFYDKIVPAALKDVLRKVGGGKMEEVHLGGGGYGLTRIIGKGWQVVDAKNIPVSEKTFRDQQDAAKWIVENDPARRQPGFEITPAMRNAARGGLPLFSKRKWSNENAAFEVAPGGKSAVKGLWDKLPFERRSEVSHAIAKAVVPAVAELFTAAKVQLHPTRGGWMGDVNPSLALKMPNASTTEAKNIAAAVAYVFDQDAGLHVSSKGAQDSIVVELAEGQDGDALYKTLPGNTTEFIGFTSSGDGVLEFLVDDAAKSLPRLQAHFGPAKVTAVKRGFSFLEKADYKAARSSLSPADQDILDALRSQARALMNISLSPERTGFQVSTAPVTSTPARTWLDMMQQRISVGIDHILGLGPAAVRIHADLMEKMPNIRPKQGRTAEETIEAAVQHFTSNILWLYDQVLPEVRERSKLWYVGGNKIARLMGKFYGISTEQAAGVIAVLSPQRDWFVNVSLARRVLDIWKHRQDFTATPEMFKAAVAERTEQSEDARNEQLRLAALIDGKKLSELDNPLEAAAWIRAFDEAHNEPYYRILSPEGDTLELARNDNKERDLSLVQWGSLNTIANSVMILRDGSIQNISNSLGNGHKVRNFYTNIIDPSDPTAITVDTHAVGAATLRPMSAEAEEVKNAFGSNKKGNRGPATSSIIGSNGTYGIYAEAYRRAAAARGILPREMQSITWEAIRGLFKAAEKRTTSAPVEAVWAKYQAGRMSLERLRDELKEIADAEGINQPSWGGSRPELDEEAQVADDRLGVSGAGRDGGGGRGEPPSPRSQRRLGLKSVASSQGGSGVVEYSRRTPRADSVKIDAWHWSHTVLDELSGSHFGQGIRGAEAERLRDAPQPLRRRVYFYTTRDNGTIPKREAGLGANRHEVRLANLWKSGVSPSIKVEPVGWTQSGIFIRDEGATRNAWEMALLDAGYDGYVDGLSGVAVVLNSDVPVQFVRAASGGVYSKATKSAGNALQAARTGLLDGAFKLGMGWVGRHLSGPSWDYLIRQGAKIVPDRVKHGLVSNFGLEGQYLDAKIDRTAAVNKVLRETKNLLDSLSGLTREQSRVAYLWMGETPDTELEQQLLEQLPVDDRAVLRNMKSLVDQLGQEAVATGLLAKDSYERNKMAYLHRIYETHMKPGGGAAAMKAAAAIRAENFKGRGIRHDVSADMLVQKIDEIREGDLLDRWESRSATGKVTAVRYVKHGAAGPQGYTKADTWEARWMGGPTSKKVGLWRDLTKEERHKLGEIEEVRFAFAKTVINGVRDIENAKFLDWVAKTYATEDAPADKIIGDPSTGYWSTQAFKPDEFVRVPDSTIAGTGLKKYGALAGKVIPAPVWNDIRNQLARPADATSAAWDALVRTWKLSKTALSPAVHTNNVMSNFVMADLAEVRARDIVKALKVILAARKGDPEARKLIERFEDSGADYGSFAAIELNQLFVDPLMEELLKVENNELGLLKASQIVNLMMHGEIKAAGKAAAARAAWAKTPFELMMKAYQSEDSVFRLAKFMRESEGGASDRDAGKSARDSFLDYNINAPWIQAARRSVLPFIAFSYRAIPMMLNAAAHKPWKFAKYLAVGYALNAAAYAMMGLGGDDEDRERRMLPDEMSGRLLGVFPRLIRMPWNDAHGSPVFLDARRWVPGGDMVDLNQSKAALPVPSWLSVSGPLSIMMEFFSNKSSFTGREIVKDTDTKAEAAAKVGDHLFKAFSPNLPLPGPGSVIPGLDRGLFQTYAWQGLLDAGTGRTDAFGRDQSLATAALSSVGVKARAYPEDALRTRLVQDFQAKQSEVQGNIKSLARELSRNGITREQFDRRVEREKEKLERASQELREKLSN